jgi:GGDEF domain-containing protein
MSLPGSAPAVDETGGRPSAPWRTDLELALTALRAVVVLATVGAVLGGRVLMAGPSWRNVAPGAAAVVASVVLTGVAGWSASRLAVRRDSLVAAGAAQLADTAAVVLLVLALQPLLAETAWALLALALVLAALRFGPRAIALTAVLAAAGHVASLARLGHWVGVRELPELGSLAGRIALLAGLAACLALLASWLQNGWVSQGELAADAERRLEYLDALEQATRTIRRTGSIGPVEACLPAALALGYHAASASTPRGVLAAVGRADLVPVDQFPTMPAPDVVDVTRWSGPAGLVLNSASVAEPVSGLVVSGWSVAPVGDAQARALHDLVREATVAVVGLRGDPTALPDRPSQALVIGHPERAALHRRLVEAVAAGEPVTVAFVAIEDEPALRSRHGRAVTDALLVAIAGRAAPVLGPRGLVARLAGDALVAVVPAADAGSADTAGRLQAALADPFRLGTATIEPVTRVAVKTHQPAAVSDLLARLTQTVTPQGDTGGPPATGGGPFDKSETAHASSRAGAERPVTP